jgi:putative ABC transport system ATP-binding protein
MSDSLIELRELTRLIPGTQQALLDQLSLTIQTGDRMGLAGASGSGKTTLMRAVAALDPIAAGNLLFDGQVVSDFPVYRRRVVYLHQRPAMMPGTVRENLQLPFSMTASQSAYDEKRVTDRLQLLDKPASILDQNVSTLSGGEQQIIALLRAIQLDPTVLLLDEPTASLDSEMVQQFEQVVNQWFTANEGRAFIWTSHDERQLSRMTTQSVTIANGKTIFLPDATAQASSREEEQ